MPVKKSIATAFVNVRGLGIVCFNQKKNRSETAIIRDPKHKLCVNVYKPGFVDGAGYDRVDLVPVFSQDISESEDVTIEIVSTGIKKSQNLDFFKQGDFDRLKGDNDENDFRWILNLEGSEMHNASLVKNQYSSQSAKPPITKLFIDGGLYYAVMPATDKEWETCPFFERTNPTDNSLQDFGHIAETMGVNLFSDEVTLKITIGDREEIHSFKHVEGSPYKIEIWNVAENRYENVMLSDLPICYEFLQDVNGVRFELTPKTIDQDGGNPVFGRNFCHISVVEQDSIENFV
jgi:hypothetical protein